LVLAAPGGTARIADRPAAPIMAPIDTLMGLRDRDLVQFSVRELADLLHTPAFAQPVGPFLRLVIGATGWLDAIIGPGFEATNGLVSLSRNGSSAGVFGVRSSDQAQTGAQSGYAIFGFADNNNTAFNQTNYGAYFEVIRRPGAGNTQGVEIDVTNEGNRVTHSPYLLIPPDITPALWLAAFGSRVPGRAVNDVTSAIAVIANGAAFASGIVFGPGSVSGNVDQFAPPIAMDMPERYAFVWRNHIDAQPVANIRSDCSKPGGQGGGGGAIVFNDGGVSHQSQNGTSQIAVSNAGIQVGQMNSVAPAVFRSSVAIVFPGAYADDAAATAAGVGASVLYLRPDGSVHIRLS